MSLFFKRDLNWADVLPSWGPGSSWKGGAKALHLVPVYAAVSQIADQFSTLPQHHFMGEGSARRRVALPPWLVNPDRRVNVFSWRYQ
ncbi:MAG: hypothetical protein KKF42_03255, partial [Actinobacteria bacterium]|nr:hypothetical protein [Actinomycetota bacterium]